MPRTRYEVIDLNPRRRVDGVWSIDPVNTGVGADPYTTTSLLDAEGQPMIA